MHARPLPQSGWRRVFLTLAALALALQVLVPQGFMLSGAKGEPALVICTGHGPLLAAPTDGKSKAPAHGGKADAPCAFAGHGIAAPPPSATPAVAIAWPAYAEAPSARIRSVFTGRSPAIPPPARAPPPVIA